MSSIPSHATPRFLAAADAAVVVEFGDAVDEALSARVLALEAAVRRRPPPGVVETVPTLRSLLVLYDALATGHDELVAALRALGSGPPEAPPREGAEWTIPVVYGGEAGLDLDGVAAAAGLSPAAAIAEHTRALHRVAMLGHLPGLPYLTGLPAGLHAGRHPEPRVRVAPGSVAVAGGLTCIYPVGAPGGWRIIGRTPVRLFDPSADPPAVLAPGDRVRFVAIDATEAAAVEGRPPDRIGG
ncbi:MAG: 5-oxoprolinase (ATP-hydrolyzing) subunit [Chloroflexota bacterium]|nr:5-oxoprolinase (ATP-hydrolyzing) subunit [Chloroflexota bacterium]